MLAEHNSAASLVTYPVAMSSSSDVKMGMGGIPAS